jgi:hypothetical protein
VTPVVSGAIHDHEIPALTAGFSWCGNWRSESRFQAVRAQENPQLEVRPQRISRLHRHSTLKL